MPMNKPADDTSLIAWVLLVILLFLISITINYFCYIGKFFDLPNCKEKAAKVSGLDLVSNLIFYFSSFLLLAYACVYILGKMGYLTLVTLTSISSISFIFNAALIAIYSLIQRSFPFCKIWKDRLFTSSLTIKEDITQGLKSLLVAIFPVLLSMSTIGLIFFLFGYTDPPNQDAVAFLQRVRNGRLELFFALFAIVVIAPIAEEYIFRGIIQNYLRLKTGLSKSIVYSSLLFSFFHFSLAQGLQNFAIITSLFILSLYLSFVYEKTRSLISCITLHVTFNLISAIKIIFYTS